MWSPLDATPKEDLDQSPYFDVRSTGPTPNFMTEFTPGNLITSVTSPNGCLGFETDTEFLNHLLHNDNDNNNDNNNENDDIIPNYSNVIDSYQSQENNEQSEENNDTNELNLSAHTIATQEFDSPDTGIARFVFFCLFFFAFIFFLLYSCILIEMSCVHCRKKKTEKKLSLFAFF